MEDLAITVRVARPGDAAAVARVYIASWHDTYAAVLSKQLLCSMTQRGQAARWEAAIRAQRREQVLVADVQGFGIVGMTSFGPSRDPSLGYDCEVYTLYVDPAHYGCGIGTFLLDGAFRKLRERGYSSCIVWAHAQNNARFFYETMGGKLIAERTARMMGDSVPEAGFGWRTLALAERAAS